MATEVSQPQIGATVAGWRLAIQEKMQGLKGNVQNNFQNLNGKVQEFLNKETSTEQTGQPGSVLSAWNTYASRAPQTGSNAGTTRDVESGMPESLAPLLKSANSTIVGAFNS